MTLLNTTNTFVRVLVIHNADRNSLFQIVSDQNTGGKHNAWGVLRYIMFFLTVDICCKCEECGYMYKFFYMSGYHWPRC